MIGKDLGRYRVLEKIGSGGMGVVYRARDPKLERDVALKILPPGVLSDESARGRFREEALTLSKLNHPHILTVHDFDTDGDVDFLVMELVPGMTLKEKLEAGPLLEEEAVKLGSQILDALAEAHEHGVVHRDLKPRNIMVTSRGEAKVLDFGLAALLLPVGDDTTTAGFSEALALAGTIPYMSPEQLRGKVDFRTDVYAAGAVLYEMVTGQRLFPEAKGPELIAAILEESPAAPRSVNSQITEGLERTVLKALEKDPARRQQSAKELREDLTRFDGAESSTVHWRRWLVGAGAGVALVLAWTFLDLTPPQRIASLAVLPLENLSHDPEQDFFADGMTDEIITQLQQLRGLRVISRTSIMRYKDEPKPLSEIREELNVGAVVEGSVLRSGERLRITARLIDASSEESLWAKQYERDTENVLALLDDVARDIAQEIHIALTPLEEDRLAKANPVKPAAYSAYLKGRFYLAQASPEGMLKALDYFQEAVREDPTYAAAYSGLADVYELLGFHGILLPKDAYPSALEAAQRAIELDPELAEAHTSLARIKIGHEWDWSGADREYRLAISLNPNYVRARTYYSNCLLIMGRVDEAVAEAHKASELDPISPSTLTTSAWTLHLAGQDEASADFLRTALELDPTFQIARRGLGELYEETGRPEEAFSEYQKADVIGGLTEEELSVFATAFDSGGLDAYWRMWIDRNQEEIDEGDVWTYYTARLYARVGDHDRTLEWLERAYEEHHDRLVLLKVEPVFATLRSDPRFVDLVRRVGLP